MIRICVYEKLTTHWNPNRTGVSNLSLPKKTRRLRNEKVYFINNTTCYTDTTEFSIKREINRYLRHQQTWYKPKRACRQFLSCVKNRYRAKVVFHRNDEHLLYRSYQWYLNTTWSVACTVIPEVADAYCCYGSENVDRWDGWCRVKSYSDYSKVIQMTVSCHLIGQYMQTCYKHKPRYWGIAAQVCIISQVFSVNSQKYSGGSLNVQL